MTLVPPVASGELIGVIGLGGVGWTAARALLGNGYPVLGYQRRGVPELVAAGGEAASSVRELVDRCRVVLLAVPTAEALLSVAEAAVHGGDDRSREGSVAIDLSAVALDAKDRARAVLGRRGIAMLDAPVSGIPNPGRPPEFAGMFASGERAVYDACEPLLSVLSPTLWYVGAFGSGVKMKLVNNAVVAMHTVVAAEALQLGIRAGIEPDILIDVLTESPASSWVLRDRARRMVEGPHVPARGSIDMMREILTLIERLAEDAGAELPALRLAARRFDEASQRGMGVEDVSAMYRL